jgi:arabinose-5-phosphate isomerase
LHPGGSLGKKLLLTLDQLVHSGDEVPFVQTKTSVKDALLTISDKGLGVTGVLDSKDKLTGIITDGDIRRGLEKYGDDIFNQTAEFLMSKDPKSISSETLAIVALELMEKHNITSLFVYSSPSIDKPDGIVHIHDILRTGIQ